ncbi:hypothetical protein [Hymenobacter yonginensis]|uniref:Uncharacterized protein n=1 Tax=Hymenobacter yonginensis TaxID=748197 RepID=A0ABY7PNA9_9BACT|nr:hypothetical protein [Hymenobacter yonginensis]WBO84722.1 hypothetical protein O9Z63_00425 [Hymenobacter yonginensis]
MERIPIKVWNRIEMLRQPIAAEASSSAPGFRRWVAIHSNINTCSIIAHPPHLYYITDNEFDTALLAKYAEAGDEDFAIVSSAAYYANDEAQLYDILQQLGVAPTAFNAPWHVEHPLL